MGRIFNKLVLAGVALAVSACSANHHSIYRYKPLADERDSVTLTDAKQRAILTRVVKETDGDERAIRRFCSEPSPDVFAVIAQSFGGGGSFGRSASPASVEAAFNLAFASAETGSTIARTQTINMLRELMFRTCERFLSGGYDEMELSIQAVRDQRLMVSILAIEQLTGAVAPSPVVLQAGGSASAGLGGEAIQTFAKLREEKNKADNEAAKTKKAYDDTLGQGDDDKPKKCQAILDARAADPDASVDKDQDEECKKLKEASDDAAKVAEETGNAYSTVKQAVESGGVSVATVTDAIADGGLNRASTGATKDVASVVKSIVELNFNDQTETMLFCLKALSKELVPKEVRENLPKFAARDGSRVDLSQQLQQRCLLYLNAKVEAEAGKIADVDQLFRDLKASQEAGVNEAARNFDSFWAFVQDTNDAGTVDQARLVVALDRVRQPDGRAVSLVPAQSDFIDCLASKNTRDGMRTCFTSGNLARQRELIAP